MNKEKFFKNYPARDELSNKYDNGVCLFVSGSYGMAGAALFNLTGARSTGASYIHSYLPSSIYPIVAANEASAIYHPYEEDKKELFKEGGLPHKVKACAFGSGVNNLPYKKEYLKQLIELSDAPLIIDAEGLRILSENEEFYNYGKTLILTPHMGEFSSLCHMDIQTIEKNKTQIAVDFAKSHQVILVLKGHHTLVVSKDGEVYENLSGNAALARAGSGDVLTGIITGLCALYNDPYMAVKDGVWLHGHLADEALLHHSKEAFDLMLYPSLADEFFFKR